jgi:hypothetical protein
MDDFVLFNKDKKAKEEVNNVKNKNTEYTISEDKV